jgi:hypothetical protein
MSMYSLVRRLFQWSPRATTAAGTPVLACDLMTPADAGRVAHSRDSNPGTSVLVDCTRYDDNRMATLLSVVPHNKIVMWFPNHRAAT